MPFKNINGLSSKEADNKLKEFGPNLLPERPSPSALSVFLSQFKNPLVYILVLAFLVSILLGNYSDAGIISLVVLMNSVLGFFQERKAEKLLEALKKLLVQKARVFRDGKEILIELSGVVPGDVAVVNMGEKIPGDGVVLNASRLSVNEAILTGESFPVTKNSGDEVFMGTIVGSGRVIVEIKQTGRNTKIGKIAQGVQEIVTDSPIKRQLSTFSKQVLFLVVGLTFLVFIVGVLKGFNVLEIATTAVALSVSAIPEGLLVSLTIVLAVGMQKILKRRGLVRDLASAETLGGVTTICLDKTGTLTKGEMSVVDTEGNLPKLYQQMKVANDLDDPLMVASRDWAQLKDNKKLTFERVDTIPFSPSLRYSAYLNKEKDEKIIYINGAPEFVIDLCDITKKEKEEIKKLIKKFSSEGKRLVGFASKKTDKNKTRIEKEDIKGFEWSGIVSFSDPVREGVSDALKAAQEAGIKLFVITGDYEQTAKIVMEKLGIKDGVDGVRLYARSTPEDKLKIISELKEKGEIVAMMGDGVNDALALKKADIGVVVGSATDVAKQSAGLVLIDSSFSTVVAAIEEGRVIFDNIRKIALYLMSDAFEEIIAVLATVIFGLPLPVTAAQILWINLVSDGLPSISLAFDPKRQGIMLEKPRGKNEPLITNWLKELIVIISFFGGIIAFLIFKYILESTGNIMLARSIAFASLGVNSLVYVFSVRTLKNPFWKENPLKNKWLNLAVLAGLVLQLLPFVNQRMRNFFGVEILHFDDWLIVFSGGAITFIMIEIVKHFLRRNK